MKTFSIFFGMIFGLLLVAALLAGTYYLFEYIASLFGTLEPQLKTITIIATIVAFFCAAIIASGLKASSQNIVPSEKINLYQRLLVLWNGRLKQVTVEEVWGVESELVGLEQQLALLGSSRVVAAYLNLRRSTKQEGKPGDDAIELLQKLLVEMRTDIGRKEQKLNKSDVLDLLLERN